MRSRGAFAWVARTSSSENGLYAISPLFDRARRIAPGEAPEDVADEESEPATQMIGADGGRAAIASASTGDETISARGTDPGTTARSAAGSAARGFDDAV